MKEALGRAADWIVAAERVVVSTGAGMSKESGIPTFRDAMDGLWAEYDPTELATEAGFRKDPRRVWSWYAHRRRMIEACRPHAGHFALAQMERLLPSLLLVTQNIDGLHAAAGSADVVELHGSIRRLKCLDHAHPFAGAPVPVENGDGGAAAADDTGLSGDLAGRVPNAPASTEEEEEDPPPCPVCGSPLRPDVVWFGEMLPERAVERAWAGAERCDVLLMVGTSGTVWPAAELPRVARAGGARVVEVNPEAGDFAGAVDLFLQGPAGQVLPALLDCVGRRLGAQRGRQGQS
ncbi:MAG: Silent information regulator protein Sir2 [Gemmatimonadetes bacterium]|nr:Silent information regulator protein Sir2 [Gemmatimonadota bacterium]